MDYAQLAQQCINGTWRPGRGQKILVDTNPFTGEVIGEFHVATSGDVDDAYAAADIAQRKWATVNAYAKRTVFEYAAAVVEHRRSEIADLIVAEVGGTALKAAFEISLAIEALKEAATIPLRIEGRIQPSPIADTENFVYREPVGVVGVISPFNFPLLLIDEVRSSGLGMRQRCRNQTARGHPDGWRHAPGCHLRGSRVAHWAAQRGRNRDTRHR